MMDVGNWFIAYTTLQLYYMLTNTCGWIRGMQYSNT